MISCARASRRPGSPIKVRAWPARQLAFPHQSLHRFRQRQKPQRVGDVAAALADLLGHLFLGVAEALHQFVIGGRLLDRVQIGALDIFDDGDLERLRNRPSRARPPARRAAWPSAPRASAARRRRSRRRSASPRTGRTRIGCSTPFSWIDSARSFSSSGAKRLARLQLVRAAGMRPASVRRACCDGFAARRNGFFADQCREAAAQGRAGVLPRSSRGRLQALALARNQFAGELDVGLAAGTAQIVDQRRQAVARRFGNAHIARNHRCDRPCRPYSRAHRRRPGRRACCACRTWSARCPGSRGPD